MVTGKFHHIGANSDDIVQANLAKCVKYAKKLRAKFPRETMQITKNSIIIFSTLTCGTTSMRTSGAHFHYGSRGFEPLTSHRPTAHPKICINRKFLASPVCDFAYMCRRYKDDDNPLLALFYAFSVYSNEVNGDAALKITIAHEMAHYLTGKSHSQAWRKKYHLFLRVLFDIRGMKSV